jgi:RND family efflux transporter MFP subunit
MSGHDPTGAALRLAAELVRARDERQAAAATARAAGLLIDADSVRIWLLDRNRGYRFAGEWPENDDMPDDVPGEVARVVAFGAALATEADIPFRSRLTLPLLAGLRPLGAIELLEGEREEGPFDIDEAESLQDLTRAADEALVAVRETASRERGNLEAITRLTRLFDLGRSIAGAIELDELYPIVVNRVVTTMDVENAYLWVMDPSGEKLQVLAAAGPATDVVLEWELEPGQTVAGRVAETGEAILIDEEDELDELDARPDVEAGLEISSLAAVPILTSDEDLLGVIEAVNKDDEGMLVRADLGMLREIADSTAVAMENARRLDAERRASDLGEMLEVAKELGSHLDVQKVTFALVHKAASVIRYSRAAVGLLRGVRLELAAVSGQEFVDESLAEMKTLSHVMAWAADLEDGVYVVRDEDDEIDADRPETREKFRAFFEKSGSRSFLSIPLSDDEGKLGVFTIESTEPYGFTERDMEAAGLLGAQATVAIRNALLYESMPMTRVFQPWAKGRDKVMESPWRRLLVRLGVAAAVAAVLILVPVPLRVSGAARVLPEKRLPVTPAVAGRVVEVAVREGDRVEPGEILAILDDGEFRIGREDAHARYQVALRELDRFQAKGLPAEAAVERARLDGLHAELDLWETRLERTRLRSPVDGIVASPRVEEQLGASFEPGDVFCEVVDPDRQEIEVAVAEADAGLLEVGMPVKIKLYAYPTRSFSGTVERIGVTAAREDDMPVFLVRAHLDSADVVLRSGMTGKAKVSTGPASLGRVMLRRPARWLWSVFWGWLP